jgi:hypothetical protein
LSLRCCTAKSNNENFREINREIKEVYRDKAPSYSTFTRWYNRFGIDQNETGAKHRVGRPKTAINDTNIEKVSNILEDDIRITIRELAQKAKLKVMSI